jgi:hypothetical protein
MTVSKEQKNFPLIRATWGHFHQLVDEPHRRRAQRILRAQIAHGFPQLGFRGLDFRYQPSRKVDYLPGGPLPGMMFLCQPDQLTIRPRAIL